ncbi:MAG: hypothetical protein GY928_18810 [Colwellia sp.]|nr:hypothetical protein [Colwellia sp.]
MKIILLTFSLAFSLILQASETTLQEKAILGTWVEKNQRIGYIKYVFTFNPKNDFVSEYEWTVSGNKKTIATKGVWEIGSWVVSVSDKPTGRTCNLSMYVGSKQCCFTAKRIGENLILTKEMLADPQDIAGFCSNNVLIKQ